MRSHDVAHVDALRHKELGRPFAHLPDHVFVASQPRESYFADAGIGITHQLRIFGGARRAMLRAPRVHMASGVELINHEGRVRIRQRLGESAVTFAIGGVSTKVTSVVMDEDMKLRERRLRTSAKNSTKSVTVPVGVHAIKKPPVLHIASLWSFFVLSLGKGLVRLARNFGQLQKGVSSAM